MAKKDQKLKSDSWSDLDRRQVLKLLGAAAGLALGLGCRRKPARKIVSRVSGPEYQKPGVPLFYSSTWTEGPESYGMVVKVLDGRPVKIEGNPEHPVNGPGSSAAMQASLFGLYDPARLRSAYRKNSNSKTLNPEQANQNKSKEDKKEEKIEEENSTPAGFEAVAWRDADKEIIAALGQAQRVVLLTGANLGPAERSLIAQFLGRVKNGVHLVWEPLWDWPRERTLAEYFGRPGKLYAHYERARVILSLDGDFLGSEGATAAAAWRWGKNRRGAELDLQNLPRLIMLEPGMSVTGAAADMRIPMRTGRIAAVAEQLQNEIASGAVNEIQDPRISYEDPIRKIGKMLVDHPGAALVVAGGHLPAEVHRAVAQINEKLGAWGKTLDYYTPERPLKVHTAAEIGTELERGADVLLCLGTNPAYSCPGGEFGEYFDKIKLKVGLGCGLDETLTRCDYALGSHHNLESWLDAEWPGVYGICQPVLGPLWETRQAAESLLAWTKALSGEVAAIDFHDFVKGQFQQRFTGGEAEWEELLRKGFREIPNYNQGKSLVLSLQSPGQNQTQINQAGTGVDQGNALELVIYPHHGVYDGRFANNAWLQELPEPASKLVWDNAAQMSPATARELNVKEGEMVELGWRGKPAEADAWPRTIELPVLVTPGIAPKTITTAFGLGHGQAGGLGTGVGFAVTGLMPPDGLSRVFNGISVRKTGKNYPLAQTQKHFSMEGRELIRHVTAAELQADPRAIQKRRPAEHASIYTHPYQGVQEPKWTMAIDLNACGGCGACVVACMAENNVPVVGKQEVGRGREMHWLRLDRYYEGDSGNPQIFQQPMLCQQCDNAPCEYVCPVNATVHSPEGLNEMVYNRCIGTRYCSNNCPYKVRRFNFFRYTQRMLRGPKQELMFNPDVTVRQVGVMEKCTFCVQRIQAAKFAAKNAGAPIPEGAVQTACQQACPARAIAFGDIHNPDAEVSRWARSPRAFRTLEGFNFAPNIIYLAKVKHI